MRRDKDKAFKLRKEGKSYRQIRARLRIPLATLSDWFRDVDWSGEMRTRLTEAARTESSVRMRELGKVRGEQLKKVYEEAREEARDEFRKLQYNPLFIAGIMLYWGEGDKLTNGQTRLSNTDPELIRTYVEFLRKACRVSEDKIKASVLIYPDIDEQSNRRFWSFVTGIPLSRFSKSILIEGRHKTRRLSNGVCSILVLSTYFKVKMLEWIKLLPKALLEQGYYENISSISTKRT
jgi:hypothetical protein